MWPQTCEYRTWINIKTRCYNPRTPAWPNYGGRGITMAVEWLNSFETFLRDMGPRPSSKHTIDRIDVNGNYEPGNCRWVTRKVQCRNMRSNRIVHLNGKEMPLAVAVENLGLKYNTVLYRLLRGWKVEDALK